MSTAPSPEELARRLGATCMAALGALGVSPEELDLVWDGDRLVELAAYRPDVGGAVLASPAARTLRRLVLGRDAGDGGYGGWDLAPSHARLPLAELLARTPDARTVCASADTIELAGTRHATLEVLSVAACSWPLDDVDFPALTHLEVMLADDIEPVAAEQLARIVASTPRLTELRLRGAGFAKLLAELPAIPFPSRLSLVLDVPFALDTARALARHPGGLATLAAIEIVDKPRAARLPLLALERRDPEVVARWTEIEEACFATIDPDLRVWEWRTGEEGRASSWIVFLPRRAPAPTEPRERELLRACDDGVIGAAVVYADWLEQRGDHARAQLVRSSPYLDLDPRVAIRRARPHVVPRTLPEAAMLMACAWRRVSSAGWIDPRRTPGTIEPLDPDDLESYVDLFRFDEHPLAPAPDREIAPAAFTERVRVLLDMMRRHPVAQLRENEWTVRRDAATFEPPLGATREAFRIRDEWNDLFLAAETEHGYALAKWSTSA